MPVIFDNEKKQEIRRQLFTCGLSLIKSQGYKNLRIEELTRSVGIGQGTFYNFFKSKEVFIVEMIDNYQQSLVVRAKLLIEQKGSLNREDLHGLYESAFLNDDDNILRYLKREDLQMILLRMPKEYSNQIKRSDDVVSELLPYVSSKKDNIQMAMLYNIVQLINVALQNKDLFLKDAFDDLVRKLIAQLMDEIYE